MANEQLPEWAVVGAEIIYNASSWGNSIEIRKITRVSKTSVWTKSGNYEQRWVGDLRTHGWGKDRKIERILRAYGSERWSHTYAYPLESETGQMLKERALRERQERELTNAVRAFDKAKSIESGEALAELLDRFLVQKRAEQANAEASND